MFQPVLNPGTFLILSANTHRYIVGSAAARSGDHVHTVTDIDQQNPDNNRFVFGLVDGQYTVYNLAAKLYLAPGNDEQGNPILVWRSTPTRWSVPNNGPGDWSMNTGGANAYWSDYDGPGDHPVLLMSKIGAGIRIKWSLYAA